MYEVPISQHIHQHLLLYVFFMTVILSEYEMISHWGLNLHFLMTNESEIFFCPYYQWTSCKQEGDMM